ncbi:hypothetical protein EST38_g9084 [Candolleomyces aberdarensis]|uniref:Mei2-like C-terminal RNA recognition motif domain-containing protein n=1 Tax=Candolleomyces aberdarensis TaxID=2316362 RepID=A0A4Q2DAU5_9AGAR|nr:hypothetical protein EST38_g9084 [Candolleomyces aberdarensis]
MTPPTPSSHSSYKPSRSRKPKTRMSYITPPLTPASSIKTTDSVDSSVDVADIEQELPSDSESSSRPIPLDVFDSSVDNASRQEHATDSLDNGGRVNSNHQTAESLLYSSRNQRFTPVAQFIGVDAPVHDVQCAPQWEGEIRTERKVMCANPDRDCGYCPSRRTPISQFPFHIPPTPSPPVGAACPPPMPHMAMSPAPLPPQPIPIDYGFQHQLFGYQPWSFDKPMPNAPQALPVAPPVNGIPYSQPMTFWPVEDVGRMPFGGYPVPPGIECHFLNGMPVPPYQLPPTPPATDIRPSVPVDYSSSPTSLSDSFRRLSIQSNSPTYPPQQVADVTAKNQLSVARIEIGQDTRTTVMIKNIPNKMSDKELITYINKVCPRRIDFLYLRMDFANGCNVGYAFVNFIEAQDLLKFAKARLGEKWNMFSSEKVLQMSYANYQGKEALVEKFKNSSVMDERESWRPKIFYSSGPNQGLPEQFPAPTHIRRKERSSYNRGALYVPGLHTRKNYSPSLNTRKGASRGSIVA